MSKKSLAPQNQSDVAHDPSVFVLPAECLIAEAESIRLKLLDLVSVANATFDASAVQRIDTACLQVFAAFARERHEAGLATAWSAVSASLAERARLLDLTAALALSKSTAAGAAQ